VARILVIDDDSALLDALAMAFEDQGYEVHTAVDGRQGLDMRRTCSPDLVISDVNMPRMDGFSLCRALRSADDGIPLILLTSRDNEIDEALGLELGADDYVHKPFNTRVLVARVRALLRRQVARTQSVAQPKRVGRLELDPDRLEVRYDDVSITVTVTEFRLLEALTSRPGVVFSRQRLMELARGDDSIVAERIIDTYVRRLRRKLEGVAPDFDDIETVIGAGYKWKD